MLVGFLLGSGENPCAGVNQETGIENPRLFSRQML